MSIHESAMSLLRVIYQRCKLARSYDVDLETFRSMPRVERFALTNGIDYLQSLNYIAPFAPCSSNPVSVSITANGVRMIEGVPDAQASSNTSTIVYGNNYGITGGNNTGNTISSGVSFEEIERLISSHFPNEEERRELTDTLKQLFDRMENNAPIEKGMLANVADKLRDFPPLLSAIISAVVKFLTSPR